MYKCVLWISVWKFGFIQFRFKITHIMWRHSLNNKNLIDLFIFWVYFQCSLSVRNEVIVVQERAKLIGECPNIPVEISSINNYAWNLLNVLLRVRLPSRDNHFDRKRTPFSTFTTVSVQSILYKTLIQNGTAETSVNNNNNSTSRALRKNVDR